MKLKKEQKKSFTLRITDSDRKLIEDKLGNLTMVINQLLAEKLRELKK
jgi:hypothetical protein